MSRRSSSSSSSSASKRRRGAGGEMGEVVSHELVDDEQPQTYEVALPDEERFPFDQAPKDSEQSNFNKLGENERAQLVGLVMKYILLVGGRGLPVVISKATELKKFSARVKKAAVWEARQTLVNSFGLDLCSISDTSNHYDKYKSHLFLVNRAGDSVTQRLVSSTQPGAVAERGLLMAVLSLIWCSENALDEEKLYRYLNDWDQRMPVAIPERADNNGKRKVASVDNAHEHPTLGDVYASIDRFEDQLYIIKSSREEEGEKQPVWWYELGPRADVEVTRHQLVHFLNQVLGKGMNAAKVAQESERFSRRQE